MASTNKQSCPTCGQSVNQRSITLYRGMVEGLWQVFLWCERSNRHEFKKKEIKHLIDDVVCSTFAYWRWFGGLAYNPDGIAGHYGLNMDRCRQFFAGRLAIPTELLKDPLTKQIEPMNYETIENIPQLKEFLNENGEYLADYRDKVENIKADPAKAEQAKLDI